MSSQGYWMSAGGSAPTQLEQRTGKTEHSVRQHTRHARHGHRLRSGVRALSSPLVAPSGGIAAKTCASGEPLCRYSRPSAVSTSREWDLSCVQGTSSASALHAQTSQQSCVPRGQPPLVHDPEGVSVTTAASNTRAGVYLHSNHVTCEQALHQANHGGVLHARALSKSIGLHWGL